MTIQLLMHPALQSLEPKTARETLLFIKAHTLGMDTACNAIRAIGLENAEALYQAVEPAMWENLDVYASNLDHNTEEVAPLVNPVGGK